METIQKIGHRGAKGHLAENTLESIALALEFGVDGIEVDVHRCKSGELVVIHDYTLERTTNGTGEITEYNLVDLKELLVEEKYKIPLLTEVLDLIEGKCWINIELKGTNTAEGTCDIVRDYVENKGWSYSNFILSSFQNNELYEVFKTNKKIPIGILSKASVIEAIAFGKKLKAVAIHPSIGITTMNSVKLSHDAGFKVNVWTVNDLKSIERMKNFEVDGIISDSPDLLFKDVRQEM